MKKNKLIILVENETLFLPHLLAQLAQKELIQQIILLSPALSYRRFKRKLIKTISCFGISTLFNLSLAICLAVIVNILHKYKFYSIQKVSKVYKIPLMNIQSLDSPQFLDLIAKNKEKIIFTQVSQKIKVELLSKATFWNKHCSLLPSYKGVFPIFWALLNEESKLGVSIHIMNEGFDEGEVLSQTQINSKGLTFFAAYHRLYDLSTDLLINLCLYNHSEIVNHKSEDSYYSFPTVIDRKKFQEKHKFGFPFRMHPSVELRI